MIDPTPQIWDEDWSSSLILTPGTDWLELSVWDGKDERESTIKLTPSAVRRLRLQLQHYERELGKAAL